MNQRAVILTDISEEEPDDLQSLIRRRKGTPRHQGMFLPETSADTDELPPWTGPDDLTRAHVEVAKRVFAKTVREIDPWRMISNGDRRPRPWVYHTWNDHEWHPDTRAQNVQIMEVDNPAPMDTVSVQMYPERPGSTANNLS